MDRLDVVTSADTAAAREAWEHARDRGAPPPVLDRLRRSMEDLWRRQADQFRAELHAGRGRHGPSADGRAAGSDGRRHHAA